MSDIAYGKPRKVAFEIEATCLICGARVYLETVEEDLDTKVETRTVADDRDSHDCQKENR